MADTVIAVQGSIGIIIIGIRRIFLIGCATEAFHDVARCKIACGNPHAIGLLGQAIEEVIPIRIRCRNCQHACSRCIQQFHGDAGNTGFASIHDAVIGNAATSAIIQPYPVAEADRRYGGKPKIHSLIRIVIVHTAVTAGAEVFPDRLSVNNKRDNAAADPVQLRIRIIQAIVIEVVIRVRRHFGD